MEIKQLTSTGARGGGYRLTFEGTTDSPAFDMDSKGLYPATINLTGTDAQVQYTGSTKEAVENDTANWLPWDAAAGTAGMSFDTPVTYVRVTAAAAYTLDIVTS